MRQKQAIDWIVTMPGRSVRSSSMFVLLALLGCDSTTAPMAGDASMSVGESCVGDAVDVSRPAGWTRLSHCSGVEPDYERLFEPMTVHRLDITMSSDTHTMMLDDLSQKLSGGGARPGANVPDPVWVQVDVEFEGQHWSQVGMRYKGNSSLKSAWLSGIRKLAFRLHFDRFADSAVSLNNQRFFGFRKMTFSNGYKDSSLMRDKLAASIFRSGGVVAARGAFARIYVDHGDGPVYFGLYTMIEDPSDKMISHEYPDASGNLYKPSGDAAAWTSFDEEAFDKKNNSTEADWSDVQAAISSLNASRMDVAHWKTEFEKRVDVFGFLKYLALNQVMVNWDSYGFMAHNYYLYADPTESGRLTWIPWDLNESMLYPRGLGMKAGAVMLDEITAEWPLIRFLLDDAEYRAVYKTQLQAALDGAFSVSKVHAEMQVYHTLIAPFVTGVDGESPPYTFLDSAEDFEMSLTSGDNALMPHVQERHATVSAALNN
jgi:spore coat protein H